MNSYLFEFSGWGLPLGDRIKDERQREEIGKQRLLWAYA